MKHKIKLTNFETNSNSTESIELPYICPICGIGLIPKVLAAESFGDICDDEDESKAFLLNYCSRCNECFISRHIYNYDDDYYSFHSSSPVKSSNQYFSENIMKISPDFVTIYNDSLCAEKLGLLSICGMGYRKSLEFLVKDYASFKSPSQKEDIIKSPLSACIRKYINDERLKSLATASTWIGNDETHYTKQNPDYGIKDQKVFINAFVTFIDSDLSYLEANQLISESRK